MNRSTSTACPPKRDSTLFRAVQEVDASQDHPGDYVFGVSPSTTAQRRIVFIAKIAERITFAEAYGRFPKLHGPLGPIHVRPLKVKRNGSFPRSDYAHIKGSMHGGNWTTRRNAEGERNGKATWLRPNSTRFSFVRRGWLRRPLAWGTRPCGRRANPRFSEDLRFTASQFTETQRTETRR